ncbi:6-bladed beta-propeller [Parabacteroides sp. PF5-6]|uniref:6-bladed beta-propeller n=1 Tax=Parabacteroides sp. PF5-6 TaxID=1742403 RepID=UPI0024070231|nr:6-bladed beta-propeller [Parabacteroides sp. PF5-6]MDF9829948.1 hypothetical protein [Parabacteroides sp. PF5-6]
MKHHYLLLIICLMPFLYGCSSAQPEGDLLTLDVTKKYPKIKLNLKDLADIEYIRLKNDPDYLQKSRVLLFSGEYIIVRGENKALLIFDRKGNPIHRILQVGSGPQEYLYASNLFLDEEKGELMVHDGQIQKYFVYTLDGDFIRNGTTGVENNVYSFNDNAFICYNKVTNRVHTDMIPYFSIVSKEDWQVKKEIKIPIDEIRNIEVKKEVSEGSVFLYSPMHRPLVKGFDGFLLNEPASDTIYRYSSGGELIPLIVREPAIKSMHNPVYLRAGVETGRYMFLTVTSIDVNNKDDMFPSVELVYDKENKTIHEYQIVFEDWPERSIIFDAEMINNTSRNGYGVVDFDVASLVACYKAGRFTGALKETAKDMDEEDNAAVMLLKFK